MALKNVTKRLEALNSHPSGIQQLHITNQIEAALNIIASTLHIEYTSVLKDVLLLIEDMSPGASLELALKRILEAMERYAEVATPLGLDGEPGSPVIAWRPNVLKKLFEIYTARADFAEAEEYAQKLDDLQDQLDSSDPETTKRLAHSLQQTSRHMRDVLSNIHIPPKYRSLLHFTNADHFPPVHRAMLSRNTKVVRFLCESTEEILFQEDILGRGTLHLAAETANKEVLSSLHPQITALLNQRDQCMMTPLCVAAEHGDYDFFEKLANLGSDRDLEMIDGQGRSVLMSACGAGHFAIVQWLLQRHVPPNNRMSDQCSPLNAAASSGHENICRLLLDYGAWVDWISQSKTASQVATDHRHYRIVHMIHEYENRPQNLFRMQNGDASSPAIASQVVHVPAAQPSTPQRPPPGLRSPPPSHGSNHESTYYETRSNIVYEKWWDLVDHPG